jgi:diketogulonate reductase-like aldo/keto reductase
MELTTSRTSSAVRLLWSASLRTSSATTAKPRPPHEIDALERGIGVRPAANQIPIGPRLFLQPLLDEYAARQVQVIAHSPFSENDLAHPVLVALAHGRGTSVAPLLLRWHLDHGVPYVVRSSDPAHIRQNFCPPGPPLTAAEMAAIDACSTLDESVLQP